MELYQKTAAELSAMLKNKEVSSVELTKAAFARTAAVEDKVGAYITLTEEHALETAAAIDAKRAAGEELAPLAGVPVSVKDTSAPRAFAPPVLPVCWKTSSRHTMQR